MQINRNQSFTEFDFGQTSFDSFKERYLCFEGNSREKNMWIIEKNKTFETKIYLPVILHEHLCLNQNLWRKRHRGKSIHWQEHVPTVGNYMDEY